MNTAFGVDYREDRGHAYMLSGQDITERIKIVKQPGARLHCHSSVLPAYREAGIKAGVPADDAHRQEQIMKGFEIVCAMPYGEARKMVSHPVTCVDCHDPETMQLRVTRPGFLNAIQKLARPDDPLPHLPSIERWRKDGRKGDYDVNSMATRQEMRSFACGQCVSNLSSLQRSRTQSPYRVNSRLHKDVNDSGRGSGCCPHPRFAACAEFGIPAEQLEAAQELQRKAQWRLDFVAAENSMGFHAPQEAARILGEAIDYARCGQLEMEKLQTTPR